MSKIRKFIYIYLLIYTLAVFGSGLLLGRFVYRNPFPFPPQGQHFDQKHKLDKNPMINMLVRELNLTAEQQQEIDDIMEKYHPEFENIINEVRASMDAKKQQIDKEIEQVLTKKQKDKFNKLKDMRPPMARGFGDPNDERGFHQPPMETLPPM